MKNKNKKLNKFITAELKKQEKKDLLIKLSKINKIPKELILGLNSVGKDEIRLGFYKERLGINIGVV